MSTAQASRSKRPTPPPADPGAWRTLADALKALGNVPASRVRIIPTPGTATEKDLLKVNESADRTAICELEHGTLVEKTVGYEESEIAVIIATFLNLHVRSRRLGMVLGADGSVRFLPGVVKVPDVCFIAWDRFPGRKRPREPILPLIPNLVVEVLSRSNTKKEMAQKLRLYFEAGVQLVWYVDPKKNQVQVFTAVSESVVLTKEQTLDGGTVLPGLAIPVRDLFDRG